LMAGERDGGRGAVMRLFNKKPLRRQSGLSAQRL
jgi:hypothetical protein